MLKILLLAVFMAAPAFADTYICDIKENDVLFIEVNAKETESITRHKLDSSAGSMSETVIFKKSPAIRGGQEVSHCKVEDQNSYLPDSKYYYISSLCTAKSDSSPISITADFNRKEGGQIDVRSLSSYYSLKFGNCSVLPFR